MHVYVVDHVHVLPNGEEDIKFLGVYSSHEAAEVAVERFKSLPGFSDSPDGFTIDRYQIDQDSWPEGFVTVLGDERNDESEK